MSEVNNKYSIKGTIYDKKCDTVTGKKDPTQTYNKYLITLEVTSSEERNVKDGTKYITKTEFPQFESFAPKYDIDSFMIGDYVDLRFYLSGQKFTYKQGVNAGKEGIMTKNIVTFLKHADLGNDTPRPSTNKTEANTSDVKELAKTFKQPDPEEIDDNDPLPF
jgi:hypothetical protein